MTRCFMKVRTVDTQRLFDSHEFDVICLEEAKYRSYG